MNRSHFVVRALAAFGMLALISVSSALADAPQFAQAPYVWRSVKVGAGGFVPGIVFSRVEKGLVYLRSDMGGFYRWDDAKKEWIPLQDGMAESSYFGGESIAPDPVDANTVYAAAGMYRGDPSAILRSHDRGNTWEVFPVSFRMGGNEDGRAVGERLAVDPNQTNVLYFGSRHDGLWRSTDSAQTWQKVDSFPLKGRGQPSATGPGHAGLSFVVFSPKSAARGSVTPTIFVGSADPGAHHLFRSDDAGQTWAPVPGEPEARLLPCQGQIDDDGILYITYADAAGPSGAKHGAVMKLDTNGGSWTDITPDKKPGMPGAGFCGLSLDRQQPGTLGVTTMDRWDPIDTVYRTTDAGKTWAAISAGADRDVSATPFLLWGKDKSKLGWWMAAFAIDPFDSNHAAYSTGATIYATDDFSDVSKNIGTHWYPWVKGIEQTAVIAVMSPTDGAHLLSGFGDIGGFVHDDLSVSPPTGMYENPEFNNTTTLDFAENKPLFIVRSGEPGGGQAALAYSEDGGHNWQPMTIPAADAGPRRRRDGHPAMIVSADGATFMVMTPTPIITRDHGQTWTKVSGLAEGMHPIADRTDGTLFYSLNFHTGKLFISHDGGATFQLAESTGLPASIRADEPTWREAPWPLHAMLGKTRDLWFVSKKGLFHSTDAGANFVLVQSPLTVDMLSFGKASAGTDYPALFAVGARGTAHGIWRSDDAGRSWVRINDDQHQYGARFRCIAGDPRIFGRVYIGTDGRGALYGEPVDTSTARQ
jgi:xyloglucan-specific exo-beta-1,4-glucanase